MREFMVRLSEFLTRRRWFVLAAWLILVAIAVPLSQKQTDNLVGGGFTVPGSQSAAVEKAIGEDFKADDTAGIGAALGASSDATPRQRDAAVSRLVAAAKDQGEVSVPPADAAAARAQLAKGDIAIVPLRSDLP